MRDSVLGLYMYAILRTAKLKTMGNIAASAQHNFRERETLNADEKRTGLNKTDGAQTSARVIETLKKRLETQPKLRSNAVLCVEYFIGASPEFFTLKSEAEREKYFDNARDFLYEKHGRDNVLSITRQYDETSPHICAYVVPIDKSGKLNARAFFGGRQALTELQTAFYEKAGKPVGLERGIERSAAKHQSIKDYYALVNAKTPALTVKIPDPPAAPTLLQKAAAAAFFETEHSKALQQRQQAQIEANREKKARDKAQSAKAKLYDFTKENEAKRNQAVEDLKKSATVAREIDIAAVIEKLGGTQTAEKNVYITPVGVIKIDGQKYFNKATRASGRGAIDLVKYVLECDYSQAMQYLSAKFSTQKLAADRLAKVENDIARAKLAPAVDVLKAHQPDAEKWSQVRDFLISKKSLSADMVDREHEAKHIYADKFGNVVFPLSSGAIIQSQHSDVVMRRNLELHAFTSVQNPSENAKNIAIVETPIEALALREMGFSGVIASAVNATQKTLAELVAQAKNLKIFAAFQNTSAGNSLSLEIFKMAPYSERKLPEFATWNEDLKVAKMPLEAQKTYRKEREHDNGITL
jgi:Plasmid recombination enzyme